MGSDHNGYVFSLGWWKCSGIKQQWRLHPFVNILKPPIYILEKANIKVCEIYSNLKKKSFMTDKNKRPSIKSSERLRKETNILRKRQNIDKDRNEAFTKQGQFRKRAVMEKGLNGSQKQKRSWQEGRMHELKSRMSRWTRHQGLQSQRLSEHSTKGQNDAKYEER